MNRQTGTEPNNARFTQAVDRFRSELDRIVDMAWNRGEEIWGQFRGPQDADCDWMPAVDIVETADTVVLLMNLPGLAAQDVEMTLVGNTLQVVANLNSLPLQSGDHVVRRERPTGHVQRTITLPCSVESESAVAHAERGVFKVEMQKMADNRVRKVPIDEQDVPVTGSMS